MVTNVTLLDPVLGIRNVSIGVRAGRISAIGRAGNPDTLDGVDVVVGTGTTIIPGDGMLATPGAVDTHVHLLSPRVMEAALSSGVTTVIGQEIGPVWGVGLNSPWLLRQAFGAFDPWPVNIGFLARGSSSDPGPLVEGLAEGGACGFKVHEDLGAHPRCLDTALTVADEHDVQVALHTDGLNEAGCVDDTLAVAGGRMFHAFHVEGCGGGHAPERAGTGRPRGRRDLLDQPHAAVRPGRGGRAPGHDRAGARPGPAARRRAGPGPDPGRHDGGRGAAARPRRHPDHVLGRAGHGPGRGDGPPDVRHGRGDEAGCWACLASTTTSGCCGTWPS